MLNPFRYGAFAFMLISHKLCRWLIYLLMPFAFVGLAVLSVDSLRITIVLSLAIVGVFTGALLWRRAQSKRVNRIEALLAFSFASVCAGFLAWIKVFRRQQSAIWEPTRRPV
jgi:hypothetical protein